MSCAFKSISLEYSLPLRWFLLSLRHLPRLLLDLIRFVFLVCNLSVVFSDLIHVSHGDELVISDLPQPVRVERSPSRINENRYPVSKTY